MFIEMWSPLQTKLHENNSDDSRVLCKRLINDTLLDLSNLYDFEFLRCDATGTLTADDQEVLVGATVWDLSAATNIVAYNSATGDHGCTVTIYGTRINADETFDVTSESLVLSSIPDAIQATGTTQFSQLHRITRTGSAGPIIFYNSSGEGIGQILAIQSEIEPINNIRITYLGIPALNREITRMDYNTVLQGSPQGSYTGTKACYDLHKSGIKLFNVASGTVIQLLYQKTPRYLINNIDRTEFPRYLWPKIIEAAYLGYGLRAEDEADASEGRALYRQKLDEVVSDYFLHGGKTTESRTRVLPARVRRRV